MTKSLRLILAKKSSPAPHGVMAMLQFLPGNENITANFQDNKVPATLHAADGTQITGIAHVLRYVARSFPDCKLYGKSATESSLIDYWIDYADRSVAGQTDFQKLNVALLEMNSHLRMRSFMVGYQVTLADLCVFGALKSSHIWLKIAKGKDAPPFLMRWYGYIHSLPQVQQALTKFSAALAPSREESAAKTSDQQGSFDVGLADATEGNVVTRFPPEASGYLHIGHAKAALLNKYFAEHYKGKLIIRFDDTNPTKEKLEYEESILEDLKTLNIKGDMLTWTSDHFDKTYQYALQMIKEGNAYVDDTPVDEMRHQRMHGLQSKNRDLSVEENLQRFEEMKNATEFGQTCCLRAKISVDAKNKALRDPVLYRCNLLPHNRTGRKWNIYPTYDFACPLVDSIEGVTHALRTNEYHDRNDQYFWILDALKMRKPHIWDYSRVNFVYTLLSKRKLTWFVDEKLVQGWDDPRFPTVRGILRRGLTVEALKKYILLQGASKNNLLLEWDKLWSMNKQIIDPVAARFVSLDQKNLTEVTIVDGPESTYEQEVPKNKKNPDLGIKKTMYGKKIYLDAEDGKSLVDGEEVTLMDWGNIIVNKVTKQGEQTKVEAKLHLEGDFKKTKKKLTWLTQSPSLVTVKLHDYDYLITKKKLEEEDTLEGCINPATEFVTEAMGDQNLKHIKKGDIIQLERRGYFICDQPYDEATGKCVKLILIPDGRAATTSLKYQLPNYKK